VTTTSVPPAGGLHGEPPAERLDPIDESPEPGAAPRVDPTDPVVGDPGLHVEQIAGYDRHTSRRGALGHVGLGFGAHEVHGGLAGGGRTPDADRELHRHRCSVRQDRQRRRQAAFGKGPGTEAAGEALQLGTRAIQLLLAGSRQGWARRPSSSAASTATCSNAGQVRRSSAVERTQLVNK
jgi:hypothetical protein